MDAFLGRDWYVLDLEALEERARQLQLIADSLRKRSVAASTHRCHTKSALVTDCCRANTAHIIQSRPDSGLVVPVEVLKTL